jgi:hypothetical protein
MYMPVLSGRIFKVENQLALLPILLGDKPPPLLGSAAWSGVTVTATCYVEIDIVGVEVVLPIASFSATTAGDGSYSLSVDVPNPFQGLPVSVAITMTFGVPVYRSAIALLDDVSTGKLNFWVYHFSVPPQDGITADSVSSELAKSPLLPSSTKLTTSPAGLEVTFGEDGPLISVDFTVAVTADSSPNLQSFVDLSVSRANTSIQVLFPASIFTSYDQIFQQIQTALAQNAADLNSSLLGQIETDFENKVNVGPATAQKFFTQDVSVTFTNITFIDHTWEIGGPSDHTVVMTADLFIGFPRVPTPGEPITLL